MPRARAPAGRNDNNNNNNNPQVGYMACSLLLNETDEFLRLAINAIHQDLCSRNEAFQVRRSN